MSFSKPSVSIAMNKLKALGYININNRGEITLTESGLEIAKKTLEKHEILTNLLIQLGVSEETAKELITLGYLNPILAGFKDDSIKEHISSLIERRM